MEETAYREKVKQLMNPNLTHEERMANFALGLVGGVAELGELVFLDNSIIEIKDESSDITWYFTALCIEFDFEYKILNHIYTYPILHKILREGDTEEVVRALSIISGKIADLVKKVVYHKHPLTQHQWILFDLMSDFKLYFENYLLGSLGLNILEVRDYNIEKLSKRYPNLQFSSERSINRNE